MTVVHSLGRKIVDGTLKPGELIQADGALARQFGASRTAMREALQVLQSKGLLEARPRAGTRVRERAHWNMLDADILAWQHGVSVKATFVRDLIEMRRIIEPPVAAIAALRAREEEISEIRHQLNRMIEAPAGSFESIDADIGFHCAILNATGNELITGLKTTITAALSASLRVASRTGADASRIAEHRDVLVAIEAGNEAGARVAMERLIETAAADLQAFEVSRSHTDVSVPTAAKA